MLLKKCKKYFKSLLSVYECSPYPRAGANCYNVLFTKRNRFYYVTVKLVITNIYYATKRLHYFSVKMLKIGNYKKLENAQYYTRCGANFCTLPYCPLSGSPTTKDAAFDILALEQPYAKKYNCII